MESEFNGTVATADTIAVGQVFSGEISSSGDVDFVAVYMNAGDVYTIEYNATETTLDPIIEGIYSPAGELLADTRDDDSGSGLNAAGIFIPTFSGIHYIELDSYQATTGTYTLTVTNAQPGGNGRPGDDEPTAGMNTGASMAVGGSYSGTIEASLDMDAVAITLQAGITYTISLSAASGSTLNTLLAGVHSNGGTLFETTLDDDGGPGTDSLTQFTPSSTGTYYIVASGYVGSTGDYVLSVIEAEETSLEGSDFSDTLRGNEGTDDEAFGYAGDDLLSGLGGDDTLSGGADDDLLLGGEGADNLLGEDGHDFLEGGTGADLINGGVGIDSAIYPNSTSGITINLTTGIAFGGEAEGDTLISIENILGTSFADRLVGDNSSNTLFSGDGNDRISGLGGADSLRGDGGADTIIGGEGVDFSDGGPGDDLLYAGAGDIDGDIFWGGDDNDIIGGGAGNDTLVGGVLYANDYNSGSDTLFGGTGDDVLIAGHIESQLAFTSRVSERTNYINSEETDSNFIWAGSGDDAIYGASGNDQLGGGGGDDTIVAGSGNDVIYGGRETGLVGWNDVIYGQAGDDLIFAGSGNDMVDGGDGDDTLFGGNGSDTISSGSGNDMIWGGAGDDLLNGGDDSDSFSFGNGHGQDIISNFDPAEDVLRLGGTATDFVDLSDVVQAATNTTNGLEISLGAEATVTLVGLTTEDLSSMTILF